MSDEFYRSERLYGRAAQVRAQAERMKFAETRAIMMDAAATYEMIAEELIDIAKTKQRLEMLAPRRIWLHRC